MKLSQFFTVRNIASTGILCLICCGCSKNPPIDDGTVTAIVENRIDSSVEWNAGCGQNSIQLLIESPLTANSAIQIALLNNPNIQLFFEDLGIAQADLVEAGLLSNPAFALDIRYATQKGLHTNIEYLLVANILDIFLIPLRTRLAATEFEQTKLKVSNAILDLAFDVRELFYQIVSEIKKIGHLESIVKLTHIYSDLVSQQIKAGNVNILEYQLAQARLLETEVELAQSQTTLIRLQEKLNRLLGLTEDYCLQFCDHLSEEIDNNPYNLCTLESIAIEERLDLQIARYEFARLAGMLSLKDWWFYTKLYVGVSGERETDASNVIGPGIVGEIPIFNYGQAARLRIFAQLRQTQDRLDALEVQVLSEVREAYKLINNYLTILNDYKMQLLPMQEQILATADAFHNVMGVGVDKLIERKRLEVVLQIHYAENVKNYLIAKVALDRALGGNLTLLLANRGCE